MYGPRMMTYFAKHLAFLAAVTEALNKLPTNTDFYVHVELRETGTHRKVGEWSDEISGEDWYFSETGETAARTEVA